MTLKRNKEFFDKFLHDFSEDEAIDVVEFDMGYIPFNIERVKDGEMIQLNEDNVSYSFKRQEGGMGTNKYSWGRMFRDKRVDNDFKAIDWVRIENLDATHKALKKC